MKKNTSNKIFHVISNTHWDREWRFPFQRNRRMLVEMIDEVLSILEREPEYRAFHLDSQSIVVDDYLEVRPHKRELLTRLVREKRLLIGPWYILPDEFHVGGENLVRNLLIGHKKSKEYGGVSKTGYSPFSWGQISQLPQLYHQFGIDVIMFYRGVNSLDSEKAEFLWQGADGTTLVTSRFSTMPRYNFYFYIYRTVVHNEGFSDVAYPWSKGGTPFHFADKKLVDEDYSLIEPVDGYYPENIKSSVEGIIEKQVDDFTSPHVIWMEGHDSSGPNSKTVRIIKDIKKQFPDLNVVHSTLEDYTKGLVKDVDAASLPVVTGERRSAQFDYRSGNLYGYITSARMYLKQKNFEAETWLQRYAEPLNSFAGMTGLDIEDRYDEIAWNYLVQNSAHDSIGGCSLDAIHEDMMWRYKQVIEIAKNMFDRACKHLTTKVDLTATPEKSINLIAVNPGQYRQQGVVEVFVDVPQEYDKGAVQFQSLEGKKIQYQEITNTVAEPVLEQMIDRPMYFSMKRYHGYIHIPEVPGFGINAIRVVPVKPAKVKKAAVEKIARKVKGNPVLENNFLKMTIQPNGTITILDKQNKKTYTNLGYLYDEGEAGHAWVHKPVGPVVNTLRAKPEIVITENGELSASVLIKHQIKVAANLDERKTGKPKKVNVAVELQVTLTDSAKCAALKVTVQNTAEDHRLRILFPAVPDAVASFAEGQFDVVERPVQRIDSSNWVEQPMYDYPMYHFVDVTNGMNGAAVFVQGLTEYEVMDDAEKTLAITLLRGFKYIIAPSSVQDYSNQKGSQCLGMHTYEMAFYPHKGNWEEGNVYQEALKFNTPLSIIQTSRTTGSIKPGDSFIQVQSDSIVAGALKKAESGITGQYVLRLHNPTSQAAQGTVTFLQPVAEAKLVTLEELPQSDIPVTDNQITVALQPKQILSLQVTIREQ